MSDSTSRILSHFIAPVVVALVVGLASSYLTVQLMIARIDERVVRLEQDVEKAQTERTALRVQVSRGNEGIVRVETKIDMLMTKLAK